MSNKIVEDFHYEGLGFTIILPKVEMVELAGESLPIIDVKKIAAAAIQSLSTKEQSLTINELLFIKTNLKMRTPEFAKLIEKSVAEVQRWETLSDQPVTLDSNVKKALQQFIQQHIYIDRKNQDRENTTLQNKLLATKGVFSPNKEKPQDPTPDQQKTETKKRKP
jgi:DNA-binding transcriptional regulator YiaG